jgi:cell division transport system permease protein
MSFLSTTYKHLRRSPYQTLAVFFTMSLVMAVAGIFTLVALVAHSALTYLESKPQAFAFFDQNLKSDQVKQLQITLEKTGKLARFRYISKEEALNIYREQNKDEPLLLEMVAADFLPASVEVSALNAKDLKDLVEVLKVSLPNSDIRFQSDIIETMVTVIGAIRLAGAALLGFQVAIMVLVIMLIVGMKIAARKEEITILRLIGATSWYVRWPYLAEGVIYGLFGATAAWGSLVLGLALLKPTLMQFLAEVPIYPFPVWFLLLFLGVMWSAGVVVGTLGSLVAVWRYLR